MREFRVHHVELQSAGIAVAGISLDPPETNLRWAERLHLPYPLLSDTERAAGDAFGVIRRFGLGGFQVELFRRTTVLVDLHGVVRAVWGKVRIRDHALDVLQVARALSSVPA